MSLRIVPIGDGGDANLAPDTVWDGAVGDFAVAGADEGANANGLRAKAALATAVVLALMTDRAADPSELRDGDEQRGWPGDAIALEPGDRPLGSKLWLLRRRAVDEAALPLLAESYARDALAGLVADGVVAAVEVSATADAAAGRLDLAVTLRDRAGGVRHAGRYGVIWQEVRA